MNRGVLISFEGIDGCGKSTQASILKKWLSDHNIPSVFLREPGGTQLGEVIRSVLLDPSNGDMSSRSELFLYLAARAQITSQVIEPALARGETVILDRYIDSTAAYQGVARGLGLDIVDSMNHFATNDLVPDMTFFIDTDPTLALGRLSGSPDRLEAEGIVFMNRVRDGYIEILQREPDRLRHIDGNRGVEEIFEEVLFCLKPLLLSPL